MVTTSDERAGAGRRRDTGASLIVLLSCSLVLLTLGYVLLVAPDASYVERYLSEVFGLADGAYRVSLGLAPSIDFKSLYGFATYYPTAVGLLLGYSVGGALAFGNLIAAALLMTLAGCRRCRRWCSCCFCSCWSPCPCCPAVPTPT
jgi:hypothetical protein